MSILTALNDATSTFSWDRITLGSGLGVPVAIGGDLTPEGVLAAHQRGLFCIPRSRPADIADNEMVYGPDVRAGDIPLISSATNPYSVLWWSPQTRYVMPSEEVALGRGTRSKVRTSGWTTTVNHHFEGVLAGCRGDRQPRWITDPLIDCLHGLRREGWVKSIEVWDGEQLIGGLFGFALPEVFVMSSAFHIKPEAAKVAIADLAHRVAPGAIRLLDAGVRTEYTVRLGARGIPRDEYLQFLTPTSTQPGTLDEAVHEAHRLLRPRLTA